MQHKKVKYTSQLLLREYNDDDDDDNNNNNNNDTIVRLQTNIGKTQQDSRAVKNNNKNDAENNFHHLKAYNIAVTVQQAKQHCQL